MMEELKSCPFCGGEARIKKEYGGVFVECSRIFRCGAKQPYFDTEAEAIEAWNRRVNDEQL